MDVLVDRCAGLDVHKDTVMAVVRRPAKDGSGREQEVRQYRTFPAALRELRAWLLAERVTQVAMEASGSGAAARRARRRRRRTVPRRPPWGRRSWPPCVRSGSP